MIFRITYSQFMFWDPVRIYLDTEKRLCIEIREMSKASTTYRSATTLRDIPTDNELGALLEKNQGYIDVSRYNMTMVHPT
jgi:hypothetical protein